jgi:ubiquinone/menaquinone biosynthesis C-methylase UbiE
MKNSELIKTQASWDKIAEGYDTYVTPTHDWELPKNVLKRAGLGEGMKFLDVASGSGALSIPAAQLGAHVTAVDLSPEMIRLLKIRAQEEGLLNLEGKVMDGQALNFEDNSFDFSGSQFGVMLFTDLPQGLLEMARVTRKGGRVLMITYGDPKKVEFLKYFLHALQIVVPGFTGLPMDPLPLPFQVSDPEVLRKKMAEAGLKDIQLGKGVERLEFSSGKEMWNWVTNSNPVALDMIDDLTEIQKYEVQQTLDDMLHERSVGKEKALLTSDVNIGIGRK